MTQIDKKEWKKFLVNHPQAHLLQSAEWGDLKSEFGWTASYFVNNSAGAQVLFRKLPLGFKIAYIPKGPVGVNWQDLFSEINEFCKNNQIILLKVEPDLWEEELSQRKGDLIDLIPDPDEPVQPRRTAIISLSGTEDAWMEKMKQKTRYNIRLAGRKKIIIEQSDNLDAFFEMMKVTGERDGFGVHSYDYYKRTLELFTEEGKAALLMARYESQLLAGLIVLARGSRAWYLHGASNNEERNRMPTYLLQWEAMHWAAAQGCKEYDLWGVPDTDLENLENEFENRSDGLWGVYRFKRGFGVDIKRTAGSWIKIYKPLLYKLYRYYLQLRRSN